MQEEESGVPRVAQDSVVSSTLRCSSCPPGKSGSGVFASNKVAGAYLPPVFTFHLVNVSQQGREMLFLRMLLILVLLVFEGWGYSSVIECFLSTYKAIHHTMNTYE